MAAHSEAVLARERLVAELAAGGLLDGARWRRAVEVVPRERFVAGFYQPGDADELGLTVWAPVTEITAPERWLKAVYSDETLLTQLDGREPDWASARPQHGGIPTSSSTLPSLVLRMWQDADVQPHHNVLEIGLGTGYSTALACEFLSEEGSIASVDVDPGCVDGAARALTACGYAPDLATADGLYGYWPCAPYDRIVAACSFRSVPTPWLAQTKPGGKILTTLGGWLHGYARILLTVGEDGTASGRLLPGTVSFMAARTQAVPRAGNPWHWSHIPTSEPRSARHEPDFLTGATQEGFYARFLAQCAAPDAQLLAHDGDLLLVDVRNGSTAHLTRANGTWTVREKGPTLIWECIERALTAWHQAGKPGPEHFQAAVSSTGQSIYLPEVPGLAFDLVA